MKQSLRDAWVKALRSGEYAQGKHYLQNFNTYCCLGVMCDVFEKQGMGTAQRYISTGTLEGSSLTFQPETIRAEVSLFEHRLMNMNDRGESFDTIADWIETNIPVQP